MRFFEKLFNTSEDTHTSSSNETNFVALPHMSVSEAIDLIGQLARDTQKKYDREDTYYCGLCRCMMPISHFPH